MNPIRLIAVNGLIRVASAATGQIIAFIVAERLSGQIGARAGALIVGGLAASFYVTELVGAPVAGSVADKRGHARVLRWGPLFGAVSACAAAVAAQGNLSVLALAIALLGVRITEGLSAATAVPTTLALLGASSESNAVLRLRLMGSFEIVSLVGLIVGYVAGGVAWDEFRGAGLLLFAAVYAVAFLLARADSTRAERVPVGTPPVRSTLRALVRLPGVEAFVIAWLAVNAVVGVWVQQAPFLMKLPERSATQTLVGGYSGTAIGLIFGTWAAVWRRGSIRHASATGPLHWLVYGVVQFGGPGLFAVMSYVRLRVVPFGHGPRAVLLGGVGPDAAQRHVLVRDDLLGRRDRTVRRLERLTQRSRAIGDSADGGRRRSGSTRRSLRPCRTGRSCSRSPSGSAPIACIGGACSARSRASPPARSPQRSGR